MLTQRALCAYSIFFYYFSPDWMVKLLHSKYMHKYVPITMPMVESFTISSSEIENKPTSSVLFNIVGNKEDVKPPSYIYPFIGTKSILLVQKDLKNFLKIFLMSLWEQNLLLLYKLLK